MGLELIYMSNSGQMNRFNICKYASFTFSSNKDFSYKIGLNRLETYEERKDLVSIYWPVIGWP